MAANVEAMVREGTNALKAGRKDEARALLMKAVELDELNEDAWLWLSAVVETEEDQQTCLENVLAINPTNERARQGLKYLEQQRSGGVVSNAMTQSPPPTPPPVYAPPPASTSTSVEWGIPAEEPSAAPAAPQRAPDLSEEDYDNWVSTLNIPSTPKPATAGATTTATPFIDDDVEFEEPEFDIDALSASGKSDPQKKGTDPKSKSTMPDFADAALDEWTGEEPEPKPGRALPKMPKMPKMALPSRPNREKVAKPKPEPVEPIFAEIPEEIRATRMPGTNERLSPLVLALLIVVLAANVGVAFLLVQAFMAS